MKINLAGMKKCFIFCLVFLLMTAFLGGCRGDGQKDEQTTEQKTEKSIEELVEDPVIQEVVIGEQFDLGGYDPSSSMSSFVRALVYNNLVELDLNFNKVPGLAESWEMSPDGKTWTFGLRRDVFFHDGTPWDSEAAKFNLEWQIEKGQTWLSAVEDIQTPDSHTLVINLKVPVFTFVSDITPPFLAMVSPKAIDDEGNVTEAIGTGPFKLVSWTKDSQFVMEKNEDYFDSAPTLDRLIFKIIPDAETRALALDAGQIDMMSGREALTVVQRFSDYEGIDIIKRMGQTSELLFFNIYKEPFEDIRVRQAVAYAVNMEALVSDLLTDLAEPSSNFFSEAYKEYLNINPNMPSYNPERAQTLLEEAGWTIASDGILEKGGQKLKAVLCFGAKNEENRLLSTAIQGILKDIGIEVELKALEDAALRESLTEKDYDMLMIGQWFVPHDDPTSHYQGGYWHSNSAYTIYTSEQLDGMIDDLAGSLDYQERVKLHRAVQAEILEHTPFMVVFHRNNIMLVNQKVKNFNISIGTWQIFRGLTETVVE
ncbi:ABC transporter substrate-binding protein [Candidatus Contubernalis alkaliaceticus]|uniref:ABC transporter substrate-binding protein n=1 Tax=Candidatus Contubernalis alkaliaceticus TaxID=338645 RepID=UPI001F4BD52D|nr:ABC transporter substrate-binding protein [Candidatus Contubernalis alkalaceticus]UNC93027.1 hypothetical protein HUE98_13560 [Candidatus Contubernalis alkalaceticus]